AATVMLFSEDPMARRVLLEVLKQSENSVARMAVCKALSQSRAGQQPVKDKEDFTGPLLEILTTEEDFGRGKLAAEATLIFEYEQISKPLEGIITGTSVPAKAKLNAIYALKLQPDMRAIITLIKLLDADSESEVAGASEEALRSLGIPVGKDAKTRKQIINELERKGREAFLRDWLIHQERQMRELENKLALWQERYLSALDKIYEGLSTDTAKGQFLAEHLGSSEAILKLRALEKVYQGRVGTAPKSKLPAELGPILVDLISDRHRDVRLKTARLLSLMGELNSAEKLLEQHKVEQDEEVKMELFVALGGACYYAFLPGSGINIAPEIRKQTLELASEYLSEQAPVKAQKGAEVIKKLLEQDGLTSGDVNRYLDLLAERYRQEKDKADGALRGELLGAMAGLCTQSVYKVESRKLFRPLFEEGLSDKTDLVREAAVDGLIYIDKTRALLRFRKGDLVNDAGIEIRKKVIELAGEVGGQEDLVWLGEKIGTSAESEPAWQAMLKIFKRSEAVVLAGWIEKFDLPNTKGRLSDEQKIFVLEISKGKAEGDNKLEMLKEIREKLAELYKKSGKFERAAEYLGQLREAAETAEEQERILAELLDVYLRWPKVESAVQLVDNCLLEKDLEPNNVIVLSINSYLAKPSMGADPNAVLEALMKIDIPEERPKWQKQLKHWADRLVWAKEPDKPEEAGD
ncbi:MAG: hypothetical protein V3W45_00485, partial [Sedimentisphaerales bacterium]